jgi:hypothetical protein
MAYRQHKKIQGETYAASGYANAAVAQPADEDFAGASIDVFSNLATATAVDRGIVVTLTQSNSRLTQQLEDSSQTLKEIRAFLKMSAMSAVPARPLRTPMIITVGLMCKILKEIIPLRTICIQKLGTNERQTKRIIWEDPKPTKHD